MRDQLYTAQEVASLVRVHIQTFYRWRRLGLGPRETCLGDAAVRYRESDVERWLSARREAAE